ncbi:MAG: patatin family protein [Christensenellaceae bacterium]|nr:patatin family protein [Christensenellaceae bacterium]
MPGLVLEGGTFRAIFSCGVLDALLENEIYFPYTVGVSAGAAYGVSYQSRQIGRNLKVITTYRNDKRYVGFGNFFKCKSIFGLDFAFDDVPRKLIPYDIEYARKNPAKFMAGAMNAETGKAEFFDTDDMELDCVMLRATCAVPLLFPAIEMDGNKYYDGGVIDPIPVDESLRCGHKKNLIVMTRPKGFVMDKVKGTSKFAAWRLKRKYPKVSEAILGRPEIYNSQVRLCEELEKNGDAVLIRPDYPIDSYEKDVETLKKTYRHGYDKTVAALDDIRRLFD